MQWYTTKGIRTAQVEQTGPLVRIASISLGPRHFKSGNPGTEANVHALFKIAHQSIGESPNLILFPEYATFGWPSPSAIDIRAAAESIPGDGVLYRRYAALAAESNAVVCGWAIEKTDTGIFFNTIFFVAPDGSCRGKYRKVHLTAIEMGQWGLQPGDEIPVFDLGFVQAGVCTCLDMSFPETCRCILIRNGRLILHPTLADDRRDICPVRCKENILPMAICTLLHGSYALDSFGNVIADSTGNGGYLISDFFPFADNRLESHTLLRDPRRTILALRKPDVYDALTEAASGVKWLDVFKKTDATSLSDDELKDIFPFGLH